MYREFFLKTLLLPIILAVIATIFFVMIFTGHNDIFSPVHEGAVLSHFENAGGDMNVVDKSFDEIVQGDCIGAIKAAKGEFPIVAEAEYTQLNDVLSYDMKSAEFGNAGYVYLFTDGRVLGEIENSISFTAEGCFEKHDYVLVDSKTFASEDAVKAYAPDINKCVIIYAQEKGVVGLKASYKALVFEEVQL